MDEEGTRFPVGGGFVHVRRLPGERFLHLSWEPPPNDETFEGVTYSPDDPLTPDDFPKTEDPDVLLAWARQRWGDV